VTFEMFECHKCNHKSTTPLVLRLPLCKQWPLHNPLADTRHSHSSSLSRLRRCVSFVRQVQHQHVSCESWVPRVTAVQCLGRAGRGSTRQTTPLCSTQSCSAPPPNTSHRGCSSSHSTATQHNQLINQSTSCLSDQRVMLCHSRLRFWSYQSSRTPHRHPHARTLSSPSHKSTHPLTRLHL
jgi:hypothetical protein